MRKKLTLIAVALLMALALFVAGAIRKSEAGGPSCNGKCNRNLNACLATAKSTSEAAQCNKAYQGCISSCKN